MKAFKKIVHSKTSYKLLLIIGSFISTIIGVHHILKSFQIEQHETINLIMGLGFLGFGIIGMFSFLDHLHAAIYKDRIEIKSLFRKRMIRKQDIISYGIGKYKGKHISGERIKIIAKNHSFKFHTSQYKSLHDFKGFVRGKKRISTAFRWEERINNALSFSFIIAAVGILVFAFFNQPANDTDDIVGLGIPVFLDKNFQIIKETENEFTFKISDYKNYTFTVDKKNTPEQMKTMKKELLVIIDDEKNAQELSKYKEKQDKITPKTMYVDEIIVLE